MKEKYCRAGLDYEIVSISSSLVYTVQFKKNMCRTIIVEFLLASFRDIFTIQSFQISKKDSKTRHKLAKSMKPFSETL